MHKLTFIFLFLFSVTSVQAQDCKELRATDEQIQSQIQLMKSYPVQAIRLGINEYLQGCRRNCQVLEELAVDDLKRIDPEYLKSKFSLFSGDRFLGGGLMLIIVFQNRPDTFFKVWVRQYKDQPQDRWYVSRFLSQPEDQERMKKFKCAFGYYLRHPELNI
jgi:hypothetical protein